MSAQFLANNLGVAVAGLLVFAVNGILMGLIIITPLAGFVSPGNALILGLLGGPIFLAGEKVSGQLRWLSDPVGLLPGHLVGGLFGVVMIAFFTRTPFAAGSGFPKLPNGLLFGGGGDAISNSGSRSSASSRSSQRYSLCRARPSPRSALFGGILTETPTDQVAIGVEAQPAV